MRPRSAIVDTDVLISGLIAGAPETPPARIVAGMLAAAFPFVLSAALAAEYREVLLRPRIAVRHGLTIDEVDALLLRLLRDAMVVDPPPARRVAPDAKDAHLWALLEARPEAVLVTGDALLGRRGPRRRVLTPRAFLESAAAPQ